MSSHRPSDHPVLLPSLLLLCNSSGASRNWTVSSSDGADPIWPSTQCTKYTDACFYGTVGSSDGGFSSSFLPRFWPLKNRHLLNLACDIFASLGPRSVYKDMLNNMVSLIDHVVMNRQNQTRTNGICARVLYNTLRELSVATYYARGLSTLKLLRVQRSNFGEMCVVKTTHEVNSRWRFIVETSPNKPLRYCYICILIKELCVHIWGHETLTYLNNFHLRAFNLAIFLSTPILELVTQDSSTKHKNAHLKVTPYCQP
jgi:hypothetical protein